jgi:hypothetical protein
MGSAAGPAQNCARLEKVYGSWVFRLLPSVPFPRSMLAAVAFFLLQDVHSDFSRSRV